MCNLIGCKNKLYSVKSGLCRKHHTENNKKNKIILSEPEYIKEPELIQDNSDMSPQPESTMIIIEQATDNNVNEIPTMFMEVIQLESNTTVDDDLYNSVENSDINKINICYIQSGHEKCTNIAVIDRMCQECYDFKITHEQYQSQNQNKSIVQNCNKCNKYPKIIDNLCQVCYDFKITHEQYQLQNQNKSIVQNCNKCNKHPKVASNNLCQVCIDTESTRIIKYEAERIAKSIGVTDKDQIDQIEVEIKQTNIIKEARNKLSMKLIMSAFDDTTIIEYFLKINHKYKSYDNVLYYFNGLYWIKGSDQYIVNDIDIIYRELYNLIQINYRDEDLVKYLKKIMCLRSVRYKLNLINGIMGYIRVENDLWDLNNDLIGFRNGVYDLRKNSFRAGKYEDYISMVIDYDYTTSPENELKWVDNYFTKIMPIKEERDLLLLLLSTILSGRHLEKFIVCTGKGRNGKDSTFTYLLKSVMGPYYYSCNPTAFTQKIKSDQSVSISNFNKKRIVITSEPDKDETIKTSMVKSLTGSDETAMRTLYSSQTKVNLNETLFMLCNDKPALDHSEQAMLDRLIVIPFRCTFKPAQFIKDNGLTEGENYVYTANERIKDPEYINKMKLPTFNYLLPYYRKFRKDGYLIQSIPDSIKQLNESYMEESDEFMNWFNSEYERTTSKDDIIKIRDVFHNYCQSDFYNNLSKKEKRNNNNKKFIEKISDNVSIKIFYKDVYRPYINGKQVKMHNILTNYKIRQSEYIENDEDNDDDDLCE